MGFAAKMTWNYIIIQGVDPVAGVLISVLKKALFSDLIAITKEDFTKVKMLLQIISNQSLDDEMLHKDNIFGSRIYRLRVLSAQNFSRCKFRNYLLEVNILIVFINYYISYFTLINHV
jgi:hypothetical protein